MNAKHWLAATVAATCAAGALAQSPLHRGDLATPGKPATVVAWDPSCAPDWIAATG